MTKNERLNEALEDFEALCNGKTLCVTGEALNMVISAVKKSQAFEAIGTVEEFKALKNKHIGKDNMVISSSDLMKILNSDSEKEIRNRAIDEFAERLLEKAPKNYDGGLELGGMSCYLSANQVKEIAEQLKGGAVDG